MSCINQDAELAKDYEIICVNDGTKDRSADIAREIASAYLGIRIINQDNSGLSVARNTGLKHSKGEFVWFVDSDDWIEAKCLSALFDKLSSNIDMLNIQCNCVYEDTGQSEKQKSHITQSTYCGIDVFKQGTYPTMAQLSIYRTQFLIDNSLLFYPGIFHEDTEFTPRALYYAKNVCIYDKYIYNYLQRSSGSITSNYKIKNALDALTVCDNLYNFSKSLGIHLQTFYAERISQIIFTHIYRYRYLQQTEKSIVFQRMMEKRYLFEYMDNALSFKYKLFGHILRCSPKLGCKLFNLIAR